MEEETDELELESQAWHKPIVVEFSLSSECLVLQSHTSYTFADLLVALGGISRSLYILGMVCAHIVAQILFKRALI